MLIEIDNWKASRQVDSAQYLSIIYYNRLVS